MPLGQFLSGVGIILRKNNILRPNAKLASSLLLTRQDRLIQKTTKGSSVIRERKPDDTNAAPGS